MAAVEVPQTLEYRGGQLNVAPVLEVENFTNGKKRFLFHIIENQWTGDERKVANLDQRLKRLIMSVLPDDQMNSVINCLTAKLTWDDLILYHEGPSNVKESRVMDMKLCYKTFKFKEDEKNKSLVSATPLSTAFFSSSIVQDFQDSPDDEEDTRSSQEYLNDLKEEYQSRALLAKSKRFFNKGHFARVCWSKTSISTYQSPFKSKPFISPQHKPELRPTKNFEAKYNKVKAKLALLSSSASASKAPMVLMALAEENIAVGKESARNEQRSNLLSKHRNLVHELNTCKEQLLVLKQAKLDFLTMQHVNTKILKENKNLRSELKELKEITKTWLNSSNKGKRPSFVKSSADDTKVTIPGVERPWLSEAENFILPNHDTGKILPAESQRNTTDPSVAFIDSSIDLITDSAMKSSVCSTPLPPLKKLEGAEPISGPKTIKSILKSKSTLKPEALKGVIINEPSSAPAKGNKSSPASKVHSALAGKLKSCDIRKPIWYLDSGCSRHMTGVKSYLHKYVEQPGPKVAFIGLKYNLINMSQLRDAKYIVQFDEKRGTIFNSNKEIVMIAPRVRDVYVLDMTSSAQESCFFAKASENLNWLWHKRLAHLNFKTNWQKNLVIGLPSLVYSKDKPCSSCEKGKHHRASFKTK
ncbi:retrovirus-related pol polyprotein from transposon TNT 1-94 [Tanacetum coccineum]